VAVVCCVVEASVPQHLLKCHLADSSQPGERRQGAERRWRHKSCVLYKKKYYLCQGKVGCPKMKDNRLIKNYGHLNDK